MKIILILCSLFSLALHLSAQSPVQTSYSKRTLSYEQAVYDNSSYSKVQSLRIQNGNVWINGNLVPKSTLPEELRSLRQDLYMETIFGGNNEYRFNLLGNNYLVKDGRLSRVDAASEKSADQNQPGENNLNSAEKREVQEYYTLLKNDNPSQFKKQVTEAEISQKCTSLAADYLDSPVQYRESLKTRLDECLTQWFELNMLNRENEIRESQNELDKIKADLEFRKLNSRFIIENKRKELIGN